MPYYHQLEIINLLLLLLVSVGGAGKWSLADTALKIVIVLMAITLIEESLAYYCGVHYHQNIPVLRVFSVIEIVMLSLYFNYSVPVFRKYGIGFYFAVFCFFAAMVDFYRIGSLLRMSGFFMFFEGISIITLSLFSLVEMAGRNPGFLIKSSPHFWINGALMVFWCFSIFNLSFYNFLTVAIPTYKLGIGYALFGINYFFYLVIAAVFWLYPKSLNSYDR